MTRAGDHLAELESQARYHQERLDLYRARRYGPRATSPVRMRDLELAARAAKERLAAARSGEPV